MLDFATKDDKDNRVGRKMVGGIVGSALSLPLRSIVQVASLIYGGNEVASGVSDSRSNEQSIDSDILRDFSGEVESGEQVYDGIKLIIDLKSFTNSRNSSIIKFNEGKKPEAVIDAINAAKSLSDTKNNVINIKESSNGAAARKKD